MTIAAPPRDRGAGEAGFTLIEVLVAFMIVALTLTMGLKALTSGAVAARRGPAQASRIEEAVSIVDTFAGDPHVAPGASDGRFANGDPWRVRISDVTAVVVPKAKTPLLRVDLFAGADDSKPLLRTFAIGGAR